LYPRHYTKKTKPERLDFVRELVDNGLPCVITATPQTYEHCAKDYVGKSSYRLEQWEGRIAQRYVLPEKYDDSDIIAVGRFMFPQLPQRLLELIKIKAKRTPNFLDAFKQIGQKASWRAESECREVTAEDIEKVTEEVVNGVQAPFEPEAGVEINGLAVAGCREEGGDRLMTAAPVAVGG
jgi:hypothetical protein